MPDSSVTEGRPQLSKTLALGAPGTAFYRSLHCVLFAFGEVHFLDEKEFEPPASIVEYVKNEGYDAVLMPNPYGNPTRLECYQALRDSNFPVIASDRGALPDSWFFDRGFNADSPSYLPRAWDRPLQGDEAKATAQYISSLREGDDALEQQGTRSSVEALRQRLGTSSNKILFVPLQRPKDTVVKYFDGGIGGLESFLDFVDETVARLAESTGENWQVLLKKHPLESDYIIPKSKRLKYVDDDVHIHDLLQLSDAVMCLNSGVGVLSLLFGRPTVTVGQAFYAHDGLAQHAASPEDAAAALKTSTPPDTEKVLRFTHHLRTRVYSFAKFDAEVRQDPRGGLIRITRGMDFYELRILGQHTDLPKNKRVLVLSPVIPYPIYRGSQTRVDMVLRGLIELGYQVSLCVLNTSFRQKPAKTITRELRARYPGLDRILVRRTPSFDPGWRGIAYRSANRVLNILGQSSFVSNIDTCPPNFRRAVRELLSEVSPDILFVNYAKLTPAVPRNFEGLTVVDTHDYQTQFLIEDKRHNKARRSVNTRLFALSEQWALRSYDVILAINPVEADLFKKLAPAARVAFVPAFTEEQPNRDIFLSHRYSALFVGSMSNFNASGLQWFIAEVLPKIRRQHPGFRLAVAGNINRCSEAWEHNEVQGVEFLGIVPDLGVLYEQSACVIAPILGGAGMKIKVVEALGRAKAVIATSKAVEGIAMTPGKDLIVHDDPTAFADDVVAILEDGAKRKTFEEAALRFHRLNHSASAVREALRGVLAAR